MKTLRIVWVFMAVGLYTACNSTKSNIDGEEVASVSEQEAKMMLAEGYKMGTVVSSDEEGDCPYVIRVDDPDYDYMLDPINLEENYKADGVEIWFKFSGLRMPNRCMKANPVNITEIQSRN